MYTAKAKKPRTDEGIVSKNVAAMPYSEALQPGSHTDTELKKQSAPIAVDLEAEIRLRAYELYEERGCAPGHENEDWHAAEQEVTARYNHKRTA